VITHVTLAEPADLTREFLLYPQRFVPIKETAGRLRMHAATARWLVRRGNLKSIKTGRSIWVYAPSIEAYLRDLNP